MDEAAPAPADERGAVEGSRGRAGGGGGSRRGGPPPAAATAAGRPGTRAAARGACTPSYGQFWPGGGGVARSRLCDTCHSLALYYGLYGH